MEIEITGSLHETAVEGREIIAKAIENKAKILVPVFAIGRTQLLPLFCWPELSTEKRCHNSQSTSTVQWPLRPPIFIERTMKLFDAEALGMVESRRAQATTLLRLSVRKSGGFKGTQRRRRTLPDYGWQRNV